MNEMTPLATPYKGLTPYAEDDAPFFFGREVERELIIANLTVSRLTLLYGASGVGKSSVLRAGVAHRLRQLAQQNLAEHGTPEFAVVVFSAWRDDPLPALLDRIHDAVAQALNVQTLPPVPPSRALAQTLHGWTERLGGDLLIILDQFEEYFLYHPQEDSEGTFAVGFPRAVSHPDLRVNFLISIREDSLAKLDRFKGSIPNLFANYLRLKHLDRDAAREAIEQPIRVYNERTPIAGQQVSIEPRLVATILEQVETGKVVLDEALRGIGTIGTAETRIETPYLQLVLTRLWNKEMCTGSRILRLETLTRLGGAQSIVKTHLDAVMDDLPGDEQDVAARIFHYLVTPSGTKIAHTVRDLAEYARNTEPRISSVLERLAGPTIRILRPATPPINQPTALCYEIFHDALAPAILDWRVRHLQKEAYTDARNLLTVINKSARELDPSRETRPWGYIMLLSTGKVYPLEPELVSIGRSTAQWQNHIDLPARHISRMHLTIFRNLFVFDMRSTNGTTLNATFLPYGHPMKLQSGDIIVLAGMAPLQFWPSENAQASEMSHEFHKGRMEDSSPPPGWGVFIDGKARTVSYLQGSRYYLSLDGQERIVVQEERTANTFLMIERRDRAQVILEYQDNGGFLLATFKEEASFLLRPGEELPLKFEDMGMCLFTHRGVRFQIVPIIPIEQRPESAAAAC